MIGKGVNHVVGTGRKACVRYVPLILGGPGRNRTRVEDARSLLELICNSKINKLRVDFYIRIKSSCITVSTTTSRHG